jgi:hypothetical protein
VQSREIIKNEERREGRQLKASRLAPPLFHTEAQRKALSPQIKRFPLENQLHTAIM